MKKPLPHKKRLQQLNRGRKLFKLKLDRKDRKANLPILGTGLEVETVKPKSDSQYENPEYTVRVPEIFSVNDDINGVVNFVSSIPKLKHRYNRLMFDMSNIKAIDVCAIVMFLTQLNELIDNKTHYWGNFPNDPECKKVFEESGFLGHMININGQKFDTSNDTNLIVKRGMNQTMSELTGKTISKAIMKLTGSAQHYRPVQSIVQEMAGNAIEHAYDNQRKHWLFCVNYVNDEIVFILSDAGKGILKTINRKFKAVIDTLQIKEPKEILYQAFQKKYDSITNEVNRNKGLPLIKKISDENKICDLKVITNRVYLNFGTLSDSKNLETNYNGTIYIWKVNRDTLDNL